jgi:hypothetical protein
MELRRLMDALKDIEEGSMEDAEEHPTGPKFTGYWKGTDPRTPGQHMVGSAEESVEHDLKEQLRRQWYQYLNEYGPYGSTAGGGAENTPLGSTSTTSQDSSTTSSTQQPVGTQTGQNTNQSDQDKEKNAAQQAQQLNQTQQHITNLKNAGIELPAGTGQAAMSTINAVKNPDAPQTMQDKKITKAMATGVQDIMTQGSPSQVAQLSNTIKQIKQSTPDQQASQTGQQASQTNQPKTT